MLFLTKKFVYYTEFYQNRMETVFPAFQMMKQKPVISLRYSCAGTI